MKIALAMIVKGDASEAKLLDRCLSSVSNHVDGIFITGTYIKSRNETKEVEKITKKYNGVFSDFKWVKDFAAARNFNFSQVPKDYDYILWLDADDVLERGEHLKQILENNPLVDALAMWYLYDFDEYKNPIVVHKKTQVVRNDGSVAWAGKLHEDFVENRALNVSFTEEVRRIHLTTGERALVAKKRNIEVAEHDVETNPNDPRTHWNLANSYMGDNQFEKARKEFDLFISKTGSEDEKYLALMRLGVIEDMLGNQNRALELLWMAIGMMPDLPDAYFRCGEIHFGHRRWKDAEKYILQGLIMKPKYHKFIVYNPRDYDYNPLLVLSKIYIQMARPDRAIAMIEACLEICPNEEMLKNTLELLKKDKEQLDSALMFAKEHENDTPEDFLTAYNKLPHLLKAHPAIVILKNNKIIKTTTSGNEIVYYCGNTEFDWNPELFKTKGFGGSEEAVVNLAKKWAQKGYKVTVYNSCGVEPMTYDGVEYKPFWMFNYRDATDTLILWRHPAAVDLSPNAKRIYVDLHDVIPKGEFNEKRLAKIDKIFVKTKFHRSLFDNVPDEKFVIIPNGQDMELFEQEVERDPYLLVNTSSPDRSMDVLPDLFERVKKEVPQAKMKWVYGFDNFKRWFSSDKEKLEWMEKTVKRMEEVGIENLGRVTQKETARLLLQANIFAYPTEFAEIDCISVKKAQAAGAIPSVTNFGAMDESTQFGVKVCSNKTKDTWSPPYKFTFGLEDKKAQDEWVTKTVEILKNPEKWKADREKMREWAKQFDWENIANKWCDIMAS